MVEHAIKRGLDGAVLQLGFVGPDRRTGAANVRDRVMRFVSGAVQLGVHHFVAGASLLLFPVEDCAAAIAQLSAAQSGDGTEAAAALKPVKVAIADLMQRVCGSAILCGRRVTEVPHATWQDALRQLSEENPLFPLRSQYMDGLTGHHLAREEELCQCGYNQEEVDRFLAFLQASGQLGAVA